MSKCRGAETCDEMMGVVNEGSQDVKIMKVIRKSE